MRLDREQARMVRFGLDDLKDQVQEGAELSESIKLSDAFKVAGEFEAEAGPFSLTLAVEGEFLADPQEADGADFDEEEAP